MNSNPPYIVGPREIAIIFDGRPYNIDNSHPNFAAVKEAIKTKAWDTIVALIDIPKAMKKYSKGKVTVEGDRVYYGGKELHNVVVERIISFMEQGLDFQPLVNFLERLMKNPSNRAVEELYRFLERHKLTVNDEGYFFAYKAVKRNWFDKYSGTIDNSVGRTCEMDRNTVDDNAQIGCSHGLHAGSLGYVKGYGSGDDRYLIVKIDPADVVSVPFDSNCEKLRTCKYKVEEEFKGALPENYYSGAQEEDERVTADDVNSYVEEEEDEPEVCDDCGEDIDDCTCDDQDNDDDDEYDVGDDEDDEI